MVEEEPPDLILLDVMMAGTDGYRVARAIKDNLATKNIPIIMVTALEGHEARMLGLRSGAEDFLTKPVDRAELCMRVRNLSRLKSYGDYYERQAAALAEQAALLDLARDAIVVRNMSGKVSFWNRGAEELYGWPSSHAMGADANQLLQTQFAEPLDHIEATLQRHGAWEGEVVHHKRDGRD